ncbi:exosortase family protein XrtF [Flavobacterium jejuense]|uniref:exosortase family protein XrtF n=1 Tax=Flavobacterium jejuense TaxID=1544455 RepID=UPI001FB682C7|nr:exosortase family protein XrtF [Flavobacterium jejuense]
MNSIFVTYKPFLTFLAKFLLFYVVFAFIYEGYLKQFDFSKNEVDGISVSVANQTKFLLNFFEYDVAIVKNEASPSLKILYKGKYVSKIIEGCNAISVIILFAAFIFAFSAKIKETILYIFIGTIVIHVLNVVRIALLTYMLYFYPEYQEVLHGTVFPLFIYGVVFLLWVLWVTKFSGYDKKNT